MYSQEEYNALLTELRNERTERKRLSREIRERDNVIASFETQENLYRTLKNQKDIRDNYLDILLGNTPCATIMMDVNRNFIFGSKNSLNAMGLDLSILNKSDFLKNFSQIVHTDIIIEKMSTSFQSVLEKQEILEYHESIEFKNGMKGHFKVAFIPVRDKKNAMVGVLLQFCDVTNMQKIIEEVQKASNAKSIFLARMSHEVRTPMNAIMGLVELSARENLSEQMLKYMLSIKKASDNLLSIINDILDFSKIESGKLEIMPAEYDVSSLIHDIINITQIKTIESEIHFIVDIDSNIPNKLIGDEVRIRQILLNILDNAFKYTSEGFVSITMSKKTQNNNTLLLGIEVTDTGDGIKQEDIGKIFETGLGLTITKNLCEAMGGGISVESVYEKGSTFTIIIPQLIVEQCEKIASVQNSDKKKILLYEKNDIYANSIIKTLGDLSVECMRVANYNIFCTELKKSYSFVFVSADIFAQAKKTAWALGVEPNFVIIKKFNDNAYEKYAKTLILPTHAISIANILNETNDGANLEENFDESRTFVTTDVRVLIVDDISINLMVAEGLMSAYMMHIDTCTNGKAAIEKIKNTKYDIVFMDHMMPELDGIETTRIIRKISGEYFANLPIIALTANAVSGMRNMFLQSGMNDLLTKPIELPKLNEILDKWIPSNKKSKYAIFKPLLDSPQDLDSSIMDL
ncbi:MAG: response regulator [Fibromonadaceae bacterium]|jgi:CheY-like chemotaxis protein/nitrogen-specific signal transduction histidine kinase|nr:response regulator [Fibromonadaceae bacterium]